MPIRRLKPPSPPDRRRIAELRNRIELLDLPGASTADLVEIEAAWDELEAYHADRWIDSSGDRPTRAAEVVDGILRQPFPCHVGLVAILTTTLPAHGDYWEQLCPSCESGWAFERRGTRLVWHRIDGLFDPAHEQTQPLDRWRIAEVRAGLSER